MRVLEGFGRNVGLHKAMLTVFAENTGAIRFYRRIGFVLSFSLSTG
jgi:RimJ/RimL family protein N-acetyltransferase